MHVHSTAYCRLGRVLMAFLRVACSGSMLATWVVAGLPARLQFVEKLRITVFSIARYPGMAAHPANPQNTHALLFWVPDGKSNP